MKTVLIIAYECRPYNRPGSTIGAQRPYQFAKWLPKYGWRAIVLCSDIKTRRTIPFKTLDPSHIDSIVEEYLDNPNLGLSSVIPLPTLHYTSFADKCWIKNVDTLPNGTHQENSQYSGTIRRFSTLLKSFSGDYSEDLIPTGKIAVEGIFKRIKVDFIIGEHGPDAGLRLATWASKKYNCPWIADFRDPVLQPYSGVHKTLQKFVITNLLKTAKATINVNEYFASLDKQLFKKPAYTITNGFDEDEVKIYTETKFQSELTIYFTGNISFPANTTSFFKALYKLSLSQKGLFKFYYRGALASFFQQKFEEYKISDVADIKPKQDRDLLLKELSSSDILLLFGYYESTPQKELLKGYIPGKTFEYLGLYKPIIAIGPTDDMLGELLKSTGTGIASMDVKEIYTFLVERIREKAKYGKLVLRSNMADIEQYKRSQTAYQLSLIINRYS